MSAVGTRTHDPLIKSQMLYRLSYALPLILKGFSVRSFTHSCFPRASLGIFVPRGRHFHSPVICSTMAHPTKENAKCASLMH